MCRGFRRLMVVALAIAASGCPKEIPQPEIDAAEGAMVDLEGTKDCAPETYQAARTMMDRAQALLKEERYQEAKTALLAAKRLADKAKEECDKKREEEQKRKQESSKPLPEPATREVEGSEDLEKVPEGLVTVYFGFNQSTLTDEAQAGLANNASYLRHHPDLHLQVEGHCDSRGSTEYNLALGERRAMAVKSYLVKLGIDPDRLEIISYGEERPVEPDQTEEAHVKNRRAEFTELKQ